jgi:phosphate starvation-inducible protein PhoH
MYVELRDLVNEKHTALGCITAVDTIRRVSSIEASGIKPRNREQVYAMDALMNDAVTVVVLTGTAGTGKCQPLDSLVYTPLGPKKMGDLVVGDLVATPDGQSAPIIGIFPKGQRSIYKVTFTDHTSTECCDEHLWLTQTSLERDKYLPGQVRKLQEIKDTLKYRNQKRNHSIPITSPVYFEERFLKLDPYLLGCLIGDGSLKYKTIGFSNIDQDIIQEVTQLLKQYSCELRISKNSVKDYRINGTYIRDELASLELNVTSVYKFIPEIYKYNSIQNRIALLQGLMDTDGTVSKNQLSYTSVSEKLIQDIVGLVQSLGGTAVITDRIPKYTYKGELKLGQRAYTAHIVLPNEIIPFRSGIKLSKVQPRTKYFPRRYVDTIEYIGEKEAQCILIDHPSHLYITDNYIVTHNTMLALAMALKKVQDGTYQKVILTRPMSEVGKYKLGALPGDVSEKFSPYLLNYLTNLEQFAGNRHFVQDLLAQSKFEIVPLQLVRGASFNQCLVIADEMQVCNHMEILTIGSRIGEGSKIVLMGDLNQRDENIAKDKTGIYKMMNNQKVKESPLVAGIELQRCERSPTARLFAEVFEETG